MISLFNLFFFSSFRRRSDDVLEPMYGKMYFPAVVQLNMT